VEKDLGDVLEIERLSFGYAEYGLPPLHICVGTHEIHDGSI
jgi:hypothetical protein